MREPINRVGEPQGLTSRCCLSPERDAASDRLVCVIDQIDRPRIWCMGMLEAFNRSAIIGRRICLEARKSVDFSLEGEGFCDRVDREHRLHHVVEPESSLGKPARRTGWLGRRAIWRRSGGTLDREPVTPHYLLLGLIA